MYITLNVESWPFSVMVMDCTCLHVEHTSHLFDLHFYILLSLIADSQSKNILCGLPVKQRLMTIIYHCLLGSNPKVSKRLNAWQCVNRIIHQQSWGRKTAAIRLYGWVQTLQSVCALPDKSSCWWDEMHSVLLDSKLQMPITEIKSCVNLFLLFHQNRACKIYQQALCNWISTSTFSGSSWFTDGGNLFMQLSCSYKRNPRVIRGCYAAVTKPLSLSASCKTLTGGWSHCRRLNKAPLILGLKSAMSPPAVASQSCLWSKQSLTTQIFWVNSTPHTFES